MDSKAPDTRTSLLQAALVCFAEHGFDGTSMRMIAEKAERPLSLLSHHFRNKEGLYVAVFKHLLESSSPPQPPPALAGLDAQGAIRLLREQIHLVYHQASPDAVEARPLRDHEVRLWVMEFRTPRPSLHPLLKKHLAPTTDIIRACLQILRPELNEAQLVFLGATIMGQVVGHSTMAGINKVVWGEYPPFGSRFQEAEMLVDFCLHGLRTGTAE